MDISQITKKIDLLNAESRELNNTRQVNIGKKATLESQLNDAFANYKEKYGVDLNTSNLESELSRVVSEKEKEISHIENILNLIREGKYKEAQSIVDGVNNESEELVKEPKVENKQELSGLDLSVEDDIGRKGELSGLNEFVEDNVTAPNIPVINNVVQTPAQPVESVQVQPAAPVPPVHSAAPESIPTPPVIPTPPASPAVPTPPVMPTQPESLGIPTPPQGVPVPPPVPQQQVQASQIKSFNAILGGSSFKPQ